MNESLFIFDFDDTLCISDMPNYLININGKKIEVSPADIGKYNVNPEDVDFSNFRILWNPKPVEKFFELYVDCLNHYPEDTWICTARGYSDCISSWLKGKFGIINHKVACMAIPFKANNGIYKSRFIEDKLKENPGKYNKVFFYDDRKDCIDEVLKLKDKYPNVSFVIQHVHEDIRKPKKRIYDIICK